MRADATRAIAIPTTAALAAAVVLPIALVVTTGGMSREQFASSGPGLPDPWTLDNLGALLADPRILIQPALTTLAVVVIVVVVQVAASVLAAYVFVRISFPGQRLLMGLLVVGYIVPPAILFLPLYVAFAAMNLAGTFVSLVLPFALASPFAVLLLWQWFVRLPPELFDAAALDGAGHMTTIRLIVVPLSRPAIAVVALVSAVSTWNSYLWPRLVAGVRLPQLQVAIAALQSEHQSNWTLVMAAVSISVLPPLIATALFGRQLIASLDLRRR